MDDNVLTVPGERTFEETVEEGRYYRLERAYGSFSPEPRAAAGRQGRGDLGRASTTGCSRSASRRPTRSSRARSPSAAPRSSARERWTPSPPTWTPGPSAPAPGQPADAEAARPPLLAARRREELARLAAERDQYLDQLRRLKAEFDNYRKRQERDRQIVAQAGARERGRRPPAR